MSTITDTLRSILSLHASNQDMALDILNPELVSDDELFELYKTRFNISSTVDKQYFIDKCFSTLIQLIKEPKLLNKVSESDWIDYLTSLKILQAAEIIELTGDEIKFVGVGREILECLNGLLIKLNK